MRVLSRVILVIIFSALFLEGMTRLVFPMPEILNFNRINYLKGAAASINSARSTLASASFNVYSELDGLQFTHKLNLYGFRDRNWRMQKQPGDTRVAFVGASMTEGVMADIDETMTAGFREAAPGNIETQNFGIGASGISVYLPLVRDLVPAYNPQSIIIVLSENVIRPVKFHSSWLENPLVPELSSPWMPRIVQVLQYRKRHRQIIWRWHSQPFDFLPSVPDPINPWTDNKRAAYFENFIAPPIAQAMRNGKFNPFMADQLRTLEKTTARQVNLRPHFHALKKYLDKSSVNIGVVYVPNQVQVSDHYIAFQRELSTSTIDSFKDEKYQVHARYLTRLFSELDIPFLDLTPILRRAEDTGQRLYQNYDSHMKPEGILAGWTNNL